MNEDFVKTYNDLEDANFSNLYQKIWKVPMRIESPNKLDTPNMKYLVKFDTVVKDDVYTQIADFKNKDLTASLKRTVTKD